MLADGGTTSREPAVLRDQSAVLGPVASTATEWRGTRRSDRGPPVRVRSVRGGPETAVAQCEHVRPGGDPDLLTAHDRAAGPGGPGDHVRRDPADLSQREGAGGPTLKALPGDLHRGRAHLSCHPPRAATPRGPLPWLRFCCCTATSTPSTSSPGWSPRLAWLNRPRPRPDPDPDPDPYPDPDPDVVAVGARRALQRASSRPTTSTQRHRYPMATVR